MQEQEKLRQGACHCGAVQFQVLLKDGLAGARRCSCSYCSMRGAVTLTARRSDFETLQGESELSLYQFHTHMAHHYFCRICGIYTHHQRRSDPSLYGVNAACIKGVSPFDFAEVPVVDGISHPSDTGGPARLSGVLRFEPLLSGRK